MTNIRLGTIHADYLTMPQVLDAIDELVENGRGGFVVTPNVDHVVIAERNAELRAAYADASLSLVDGMPLVWASRLIGAPLPEKISGSDLVRPLLIRAAKTRRRVYFLGAAPGVGQLAAEILMREIPGLDIVGVDAPPLGFHADPRAERQTYEKMQAARPHLVLMALGCPKQELLMHRWHRKGARQVMLGVGASLDFVAGTVRRAPPWMSRNGLEWLYRLSQDPRRLARRYLIRDMAFLPILVRMMITIQRSKQDYEYSRLRRWNP